MANPAAAINAGQGAVRASGQTSLSLGFTPTSGNVLVLITTANAVQSISGWTKHRSAVSELEVAFWTRTATGTEGTVTYSQNGPRALAWAAIELPAGTTFSLGSGDGASNDTFPAGNTAGLSAGNKVVFFAVARELANGSQTFSATWSGDTTEWVDLTAPHDGASGVGLSVGFYEGTATTVVATMSSAGGQPTRHMVTVAAYLGTGGGGGNVAPTANAGIDQNVTPGTLVTLSGSGSTDSDGTVVDYSWGQVSGPASVTLAGTGASRTFTPTVTGTYVFSLTVLDDDGASSSADTISVVVATSGGGGGGEDPPSALNVSRGTLASGVTTIPVGFTPTAGSLLVLIAGAAATQTIAGWTKHISVINQADVAVYFKIATGSETSITFTQNAARSLSYTLVELPAGTSLSEGVADLAGNDVISSAPTQGFPAGVNKIVFWISGRITNGAGPTAVGTWGSNATEMVELVSAHEGLALFVGYYEGTAVNVSATSDTTGSNALATTRHQIIIAATPPSGAGNTAPVANAGPDQSVAPSTLVTLNASASTDSDGTIASYSWTQLSGTGVTLSGSGATRTFTPTAVGTYSFQVLVTDDDGATATDSVQVIVQAGNLNPTANAGADQAVTIGTLVTLSGSASSDPDGTISGYSWGQTSGATVTLAGTGASRTFTPSTPGARTFQLTVTDNNGATSTDSVVITVSNPASNYGASVAAENALTGDPSTQWWDGLSPMGLPSFPRRTYYAPGETAYFSVDCQTAFNITIHRLGHYGGNGARLVQSAYSGTPTIQPAPVAIAGGNGAVTCAAWQQNGQWAVPADALPGWYMATFRRTSDSQHGYCLFLVSDAAAKRPVVIVTGDATWHAAYSGFGGNNVYGASESIGSIGARAFVSTYDKPVLTHFYVPQTHFFNNTYPYVAWSERMGYEASAVSIEQINNDPTILDGRAVIIFVGHNEYIPQSVMTKTKSLLTGGQRMVNVAGNDFFWRVKMTNGAFSSSTPGRNMWCKKDTMSGPSSGPDAVPSHAAGVPFTTAADWTGTWQDTRWVSREPSENFFGDQFIANGIREDAVRVPVAMKNLPPWRSCPGVIALGAGQSYNFAAGTLGMEWDRPMLANPNVQQVLFSSTEIDLSGAADANGETYGNVSNDTIHGFAMVKSGNGYVANFNSDQWAWALSQRHLRGNTAPDVNAMQMMLNVISDLGVQPATSSVTSAGLTVPTPQPMTAYGFTDGSTPPPDTGGGPSFASGWYSNGTEWIPVGQEIT